MGCGSSHVSDPRGHSERSKFGRPPPKRHQTRRSNVEDILRGNLSPECPSTARIVRIFTSSTFTDTRHERNALMERVYPRLKEVCQQRGYEFQVVDMRWGIRDEATDDHMTTDLCLREVDLCKKLSTGPCFVTFLSHKYGYRYFPREIEAIDFDKLLSEVTSKEDSDLLKRWYKKDVNSIPATYVLQPISSLLPDFRANDEARRKIAKADWSDQNSKMQSALSKAAKFVFGGKKADKYAVSVTEAEIRQALSADEGMEDRCVWFDRRIQDLENQNASYLLSRYIECLGPEERDVEARERLSTLKEKTLCAHLPNQNIKTYNVPWTDNGIDPSQHDQHQKYIDQLCDDFLSTLSAMIESAISAKAQSEHHGSVLEEVVQHTVFCQEKARAFQGRAELLEDIEKYLKNTSRAPLVVHGPSGSGKTSVTATAAIRTWEVFSGKCSVVIRFIGTTPDSSSIGGLLVSIIKQIGEIYKFDTTELPPTTKELREYFKSVLCKASKDVPLVLFLDSLDQIDASGDAKQLSWLPKQLPDNVKIVLSTLPEAKYEILPRLQALFPDRQSYLDIPSLEDTEVSSILDTWLDQASRKLTTFQRKAIELSFYQCPLPLFLKLSFDKALTWRSYTPAESFKLQVTVRGCIDALFQRLERLHGELLVQRALGYLTLSKSGLSESELEDILSCDDDVLNDVYTYWTPPIRRLPPLLLVRLKGDLGQYLVDRGADGVRVFFWYHRQFIEAATERYCSDPNREKQMHTSLAEFFSGTWADGTKKPYRDSKGQEEACDRHVTSQPVMFGENYNRRKLNNLPFHRIKSQQSDLLMKECLCNYEFLSAKLKSEGLRNVIDDFLEASSVFLDVEAMKTVMEAMHLSQAVLAASPEQFQAQMITRIKDTKGLEDFLSQCHKSPTPFLLPSDRVVTQTGGPLLHALAEHTNEIAGLDLSSDGKIAVTCGLDQCVKTWDVQKGKLLRSIDEVGADCTRIFIACNDSLLIVSTKDSIRAFNIHSGVEKYTLPLAMYKSGFCLGADDRSAILVVSDQTIQVFNAEDGSPICTSTNGHLEEGQEMGRESVIAASGELIAVTECKTNNKLFLFDVREQLFTNITIVPPILATGIKDVICCATFSADRKHVIIGAGQSRDILFYDVKSGDIVRTLEGVKHDRMSMFLHASRDGKFLVSSNWNHVMLWDLQQNQRHIALQHPHRSLVNALTVDMRIFVTASNDLQLRIWDLSRDSESEGLGVRLPQGKGGNSPPDDVFAVKSLYQMGTPRFLLLHGSFSRKKMAKQYLRVYDVVSDSVVREVTLDKSDSLIVPYGDKHVLVGSWKRTVRVIDLVTLTFTNQLQGILPKMATAPNDIVVIDGNIVVTPTKARRNVKIYDLDTGRVKKVMKGGQKERISAIKVSPSGKTLIAGTTKGPLLLFDLRSFSLTYAISQSEVAVKNVLDIRVTGCDKLLLYKPDSGNNSIVVWDINTRKDQRRLRVVHPSDSAVKKFEVLDTDVVVMVTEGFIHVFQLSTGDLQQTIACNSGTDRLCCHPNITHFVTYSNQIEDNMVRLWSTSPVQCMASFTPDVRPREMFLSKDGVTPLGFFHTTPNPVIYRLFSASGDQNSKNTHNHETPYSEYMEADLSEIETAHVTDPEDPDTDEEVVT